MVIIDLLSTEFLQITGIIITLGAVVGTVYKGTKWLLDEVKKENIAIREQVKKDQAEIKLETVERIEANKQEVRNTAVVLSNTLAHNTELLNTKLDVIQSVIRDNKNQLEGYAKNIAKTVQRNNEQVNEHETRISVLETKLSSAFEGNSRTRKDSLVGKHLNKHISDNDSSEENGELF